MAKTLELDRLTVRDIIVRDAANVPIVANKTLVTGDNGRVYFKDVASGSGSLNSFNTVKAGANIKVEASASKNTLWLEPGAGIAYTSIIDGLQPKIFISAVAPEQITIRGGETLKFTSLYDVVDGGRTLYFAGKGDTTVSISDATIVIGSATNSSYGGLQSLTSTTKILLADQSTLTSKINTALNMANLAATVSTITQFNKTLNTISTFVYKTFTKDSTGNNAILNVTKFNTSTLTVGANIISDSNIPEYNMSQVGIGILSTTTNLLTFKDTFTGVKNGFEKEYMHSISTFGTTTYNTQSQGVQLGFYPMFSTQASLTQYDPNSQFVPVIQQIELLQQTVYKGVPATSTQTKYTVRNIGRFDELYAAGNTLCLGGNIVISTLTVSSINKISTEDVSTFTRMFVGQIEPLYPNNGVTISSINISSINGRPFGNLDSIAFSTASAYNIVATYISSQSLSSAQGYIKLLDFSSAVGKHANILNISSSTIKYNYAEGASTNTLFMSTGALQFGDGTARSLNLLTLSSGALTYDTAAGKSISSQYISTGGLRFGNGTATSLNLLTLSSGALTYDAASGKSISSQYISTGGLRFDNGTATSLNLLTLSSGALTYDAAAGKSLSSQYVSTGGLRFGDGTAASLNLLTLSSGAMTYDAASGKSLSSQYVSTAGLRFGDGTATSLNLLTLSSGALTYDTAAGKSLSSQYVSTGGLRFGNGTATSLNLLTLSSGALTYDTASGKSISSQYVSTGGLRFDNGTATSLNLLTLSSGALTYDAASGKSISSQYVSTGGLRFGDGTATSLNLLTLSSGALTYDAASGKSLSSQYVSTGGLRFGDGTATSLNLLTLSSGALTYDAAAGKSISSQYVSTGGLRFGNGTAASLNLLTLSSGALTYDTASGKSVGSQYISTGGLRFGDGTAASLNLLTLSSGQIGFDTAFGAAISTTNAYATQIQASSIYGNVASISSVTARTINVTYVSSYAISSYNTSSELLTFGQGKGSSLAVLTMSTGRLYYGNATGTSISTVYISTGELRVGAGTCSSLTAVSATLGKAVINDLVVNTINGVNPVISTFSTVQWASAVGNKANISSLRVSTIMGVDLPIFTFDMQNRRVGLNLGATQQPRATMDVNGIVYANNFVTSSDRRLKTNLRPLEAPVEIPQAYRYNWIEGGAEDIGVMADEIEAIAPECVYTRPDGYKAVSYSKLVPVVLTLLRGLSLRVAQLEHSAGC